MRTVSVLFALSITLSPVQAHAHAHLIKSVPAASSEVSVPRELVLTYTEALEPTLVKVAVSSGSKPVAGTGEPEITASGKGLHVALPVLSKGAYTVEWDVVSKDGHRTRGSFEFKVK